MDETFATTLTNMLDNVGDFVTSSITWMRSFISIVTDSPVLTLFVIAVPLVGLGVGLLNRLIRAN